MMGAVLVCLAVLAGAPQRSVDFDSEIIPILTRSGCNAGACHGAAAGRGGLHLSLWGADPAADHEAIAQALEGRRINLARPERSLLLTKPTGQLDHGGDRVLDEDGAGAKRILEWIRSGARRAETVRRLTSLEVSPRRQLIETTEERIPIRVIARFDDGPPEDVTYWTVLTSSDPASVKVDRDGTALVKRRGQHVVIARFLDRVIPIQLNVPLSDVVVDLTDQPRANFIDEEVLRVLSELRLPVSPPAADHAWLRRVTLDLTGRLPRPEVVDAFECDESADKRSRMVTALLSSEAFTDYWTFQLARWLHLRSLPGDKEGAAAYADWLRQSIERGVGFDEMARQLITAIGDSHVVGPSNFSRLVADARGQAERVGQFFLGARLGCANCHNHPLDRWTQDDYHGLAAIFAPLERGRHVRVGSHGAVTNLRTGQPAVPRIPGERYLTAADGDHREQLAIWLTSDENRYFAKAMVNRLWRSLLGRGLADPADDLRETNPATHPELLDLLADDFVEHGYSLRHTLQRIALSHTYARGEEIVGVNAIDDRFYSRGSRRALPPEVLADAIADVTGVSDEYAGRVIGTRAVWLVDPLTPAPSLDILGRCSPTSGCDENIKAAGGLPAQLHLLNGELINRKLVDTQGRLQQLIAAGNSDGEIVDEFYRRALSRHPDDAQRAAWCEALATDDPDQRRERLEDFVWSMLNSRQFMENH